MEAILSFFSDLILFTAGVFVALIWIVILIFIIDESIDLFITIRNRGKNQEDADE